MMLDAAWTSASPAQSLTIPDVESLTHSWHGTHWSRPPGVTHPFGSTVVIGPTPALPGPPPHRAS